MARRIRMHIETWDRTSLGEQETIFGRTKREGAPLSGGTEFSEPDLAMPGRGGPIIPVDSHVALAHPDANGGVRMLRRGFNYTDGSDGLGRLDAGLFFIAFVIDPRTHYVPMQNAMAKNDALVEYLKHTGSGLFAVPPGIAPGQYLGQSLFTRGNGARPRTRLESKRGGTAGTTKVVAAIPPARGSAAGNGRSA